jgi:hypothetical protein
MEPLFSLSDFEASVRKSGMVLTQEQVVEIYTGWGFMEPLLARLRGKDRARAAELAHIFNPEQPL